jgi:hypothetical protein
MAWGPDVRAIIHDRESKLSRSLHEQEVREEEALKLEMQAYYDRKSAGSPRGTKRKAGEIESEEYDSPDWLTEVIHLLALSPVVYTALMGNACFL